MPKSGQTKFMSRFICEWKKVQSEWFHHEGKVIRNRDHDHQVVYINHEFPHDHNWIWMTGIPKRGKEGLEFDYINYR